MRTAVLGSPTSLGDVVLHAGYGEDGELTALEVLRADPRILISGQFLRELAAGAADPRVPRASVTRAGVGGVLRIRADNRTLVYVLTEFEPVVDGIRAEDIYTGEWPD